MNDTINNELLNEKISKAMNGGVESQNATVKTSLRLAREAAVAELDKPLYQRMTMWLRQSPLAWPGIGGLALIMIWLGAVQITEQPLQNSLAGTEISLDQDEMDLYEDYEFYSWLAKRRARKG